MTENENGNGRVVSDKPLNQSQVKNLKEIVEGDFNDMRNKIHDDIERRYRERIAEIEEEYNVEEKLVRARKVLSDAGRQAEDLLRNVSDELLKQGFGSQGCKLFQINTQEERLVFEGKAKAMRRAKDAKLSLNDATFRVIDRMRRKVTRAILLESIDRRGALEILDDVPDSETLLSQAIAEISTQADDALKELVSEQELDDAKSLTQ